MTKAGFPGLVPALSNTSVLPSEEALARDVVVQSARRNHPVWCRPRWGKASDEASQVLKVQNLRRYTLWG